MSQSRMFDFGSEMTGGAEISDDGLYRYQLWRRWDDGSTVNFIMCNPSTADASIDDPTIRRCLGFAQSWGYSTLVVTNLYALRSTDPRNLTKAADPIGPENDEFLKTFAERSDSVVCAWGANVSPERSAKVVQMLRNAGIALTSLRLTKGGYPCHPLYLPADLKPVAY